jgi:hypothetical protein
MANPTPLLNDDGTASMATMFLMAHHGLRRDLDRFAAALGVRDPEALRTEWPSYHQALHGHHMMEDTRIFPQMRTDHPELAAILDRLDADHRRIDPMLARGDQAFAGLPGTLAEARAVVADLQGLLPDHLATEEASIVPHLRGFLQFPAPASDAEAAMYADGFAWTADGVPEPVLAVVFAVLPPAVVARLPAARAAYAERCRRVWG